MNAFGLIGFAQPLVLAALVALPAIWWLLRYTPPRPQQETFPPTRILREIVPAQEERATSPWWLTLLRMAIAALLILALAGPTLNPAPARLAGDGPLLILIDNGWGSARLWPKMTDAARALIDEAASTDRMIHLVPTAAPAALPPAADAAEARDRLQAMRPLSHAPDRPGVLRQLGMPDAEQQPGEIVWLSDGLDHGNGGEFGDGLAAAFPGARIMRIEPPSGQVPLALGDARTAGSAINVAVLRRDRAGPAAAIVEARDARGRLVASADAAFAAGERQAAARFEMPVELRNAVTRLEIAGARHAGAVRLLDDRFLRRTVGLVSGTTRDLAQPLLDPLHYITRALQPIAELRVPEGADIARQIDELLGARVDVIVLADIGTLPEETVRGLDEWVRGGGLLVRFAGPRLANGRDALLPVTLRPGQRILGGPLSWSEPQPVGGLREDSPLAGLTIPAEVTVRRQILAEPSPGLDEATWAWLADGTPLVTGAPAGQGQIVLFHVTADARWSNLPLTGLFSGMLDRLVELAAAGGHSPAAPGTAGPSRPLRLLDANGVLIDASGEASPLPAVAPPRGTPENPPGLYGDDRSWRALNALAAEETLEPIADASGAAALLYPDRQATDLAPWAFLAALVLLLADTLAVLLLGGLRGFLRRFATAAVPLLLAGSFAPPPAQAQQSADDARAIAILDHSSLAYVMTGDPRVDAVSKAGMEGLSRVLADRTAFEPGPPVGIDPERDEMAFYALIYWPVRADGPPVPQRAVQRIDAFMKQGGTVLFDTADQLHAASGGTTPNQRRLAELLGALDLPALEPVPADHVLTKSFYLLADFPGRYQGAPLWVERLARESEEEDRPARGGDGVSPLLVTGNDFAAAWAADARGQPLYPVTPGGERQREMSYRVGINIVMYTLTGNYKTDQVHVPALLERLGQ